MQKLQGVNLGGWLILEKWMTPELFNNLSAEDEFSLINELGKDDAQILLEKHWQTFITKDDLIWIKNNGLNALRIPVGYWNFVEDEIFISAKKYFDQLIIWCNEIDLNVVIDLHGAPGSQNGNDHSGRIGEINWHISPENINQTLNVLEIIAKEYGSEKCVVGIELLNEPHWDIPLNKLKNFYIKGYEIVRQHSEIYVIMHDAFRPTEWKSYFKQHEMINVLLDLHLYQCFAEWDKKLNMEGHLQKVEIEWKNMILEIQEYVPVIIGEWSNDFSPYTLGDLNEEQLKENRKSYFETQKKVFEHAKGWFFWNYKINNEELKEYWSFKDITQ